VVPGDLVVSGCGAVEESGDAADPEGYGSVRTVYQSASQMAFLRTDLI
jgi:hypothetical protein